MMFDITSILDPQEIWRARIKVEFKTLSGGDPFVIREGMLKRYSNGSWRRFPEDFARILALMEDEIEKIVNIEALDRAQKTLESEETRV